MNLTGRFPSTPCGDLEMNLKSACTRTETYA